MRHEGILVKWNDERGFGFIRPLTGGDEVFVHVSAFGHGGARPQLNEKLSFEIDAVANGKKKAVRVMRPASGRIPESRVVPPRAAAPRPVRRGRLVALAGGAADRVVWCARLPTGHEAEHETAAAFSGAVVAAAIGSGRAATTADGFTCAAGSQFSL
ncbi:MAG: cold shock domain-containing protein [Leptothrix sp. (in: b-proteobacteria)]